MEEDGIGLPKTQSYLFVSHASEDFRGFFVLSNSAESLRNYRPNGRYLSEEEFTMKQMTASKRQVMSINLMTKIGLLAALAGVLMLFEFPLWFAPPFYELDLSELPVLIGTLALGPLAGVFIELVKILLNLAMNGTVTFGVGEAANFLIGCAFILPVGLIYKKYPSFKGLSIGLGVGIISLCAVGALANYFLLLPVYSVAFGIPLDGLVAMGSAVNPAITNMATFILWAVVPFNLLKGTLISLLGYILYKKVGHHLSR